MPTRPCTLTEEEEEEEEVVFNMSYIYILYLDTGHCGKDTYIFREKVKSQGHKLSFVYILVLTWLVWWFVIHGFGFLNRMVKEIYLFFCFVSKD